MLRVKDIVNVMVRLPCCCLLTSTLTMVLITCISLEVVLADTTPTTTTTTETPFIKSTMFIGLAAGVGGFLGFLVLCCVLWKCCCGEKN